MNISVSKIGPINKADFEIGNFNILCGYNNTGKTYATYSVYGFCSYFYNGYELIIDDKRLDDLYRVGNVKFLASDLKQNIHTNLSRASSEYSKLLYEVFSAKRENFKNSEFSFTKKEEYLDVNRTFKMEVSLSGKAAIKADVDDDSLLISLIDREVPRAVACDIIGDAIKTFIYQSIVPKAFISSAERTGAAIFQRELDFSRNKLISILNDKKEDVSILPILLSKVDIDYPLPVVHNVDFARSIPSVIKKTSYIAHEHPLIIDRFRDIAGGDYSVTKEGAILFVPSNKKNKRLSLDESSSSVRALADLNFYIKNVAKKNDLLIIDEPELNLHPQNQRLLARLLAMLLNVGIKIFITTHSDYIINEINNLVMLKLDERKSLREKYGYSNDELVDVNDLKVYYTQLKGASASLKKAKIDKENGIELPPFNKIINEMNSLQDEILWG